MTRRPLVLAIVPATSASSTMDRLASSSSSSIVSTSGSFMTAIVPPDRRRARPNNYGSGAKFADRGPRAHLGREGGRVGGARRWQIEQCDVFGQAACHSTSGSRGNHAIERECAKIRKTGGEIG